MATDRMTAEQVRAAEAREGASTTNHMNEMLAITNVPDITEGGWLDISTAPYDGRLVQVRDRGWAPCRARYVGTQLVDGHWQFVEYTSFLPTHWKPIQPLT